MDHTPLYFSGGQIFYMMKDYRDPSLPPQTEKSWQMWPYNRSDQQERWFPPRQTAKKTEIRQFGVQILAYGPDGPFGIKVSHYN